MDTGKILLGVLAGLAVGATFGILFAPDKGSSTRRLIGDKSEDYLDDLGNKFNEFIDDISEKFEDLKEQALNKVAGDVAKEQE